MPQPDANLPSTDPATWVDRYGDYLYRYAFFKTGDARVAEDLVQEAFLAALKGHKDFRSQSSVKTWLTAILNHKLMDHFRQKYRRPQNDVRDAENLAADADFNGLGHWRIKPGNWVIDPATHYEQKEFLEAFNRCLAELPQRHAQAFAMREIEGLSTREICKMMEITTTNCWVILHRARMALRRCLELNWFTGQGKPS